MFVLQLNERPLDVPVLHDYRALDVSVLQQTLVPWTCLFYSRLCSALDVSFLYQTIVPWTFLLYNRLWYLGRVCSTADCSALDVSFLQ